MHLSYSGEGKAKPNKGTLKENLSWLLRVDDEERRDCQFRVLIEKEIQSKWGNQTVREGGRLIAGVVGAVKKGERGWVLDRGILSQKQLKVRERNHPTLKTRENRERRGPAMMPTTREVLWGTKTEEGGRGMTRGGICSAKTSAEEENAQSREDKGHFIGFKVENKSNGGGRGEQKRKKILS